MSRIVSYETQTLENPNPIARFAHTQRYARSVSLSSDLLPEGGAIVDFGAGTGHMLATLHKRRPDVRLIAIEPFMPQLPDPAITYLSELSRVRDVDLVTCFEVIEHLLGDEVERFLDDARQAIRPEGRVVISVPIMQGPVLPLKVVSGAMLHRRRPEYSLGQLVRGTLGLSVPRVPDSRHSHRGFDFRELRGKILKMLDIEQEFYSPFTRLSWTVNSQAFFVCAPKK
ncbi:bifunctional 2-polyprenyl-6-hydroxyphenol methylase/3-demethylubiquinol 3-O-methyltransferase UbiG [Ancylobacter sp. TS-1]|uniref:class I SAM-dependent methyltransferase n=1 Tax=Ancylobacter sp. TS-1 TaxID=1850374 RepID=UPI001391DED3|nr:methyltransferase domain-containing protein [Ancylobacter sp. TS-1]